MRNNKVKRVIIPAVAVITAAVAMAAFFMKRYARKGRYAAVALIAVVILCGASMTAYATEVNGEPDLSAILTPVITPEPSPGTTTPQPISVPDTVTIQEPEQSVEPIAAPEQITTATPESTPSPDSNPNQLTPAGNLTLVDDLSGAQTNGKQFITVVTKSGAYFYLVIDRTGNKDNVYFLNLVDEADLMAIMQKDKTTAATTTTTPASVTPAPEQTPATDTTPEPKKTNMAGILIVLLIIGVVGGGAYYYFKVRKPKSGGK